MDPQSNEEDDRPKWDETPELLALKELVNREVVEIPSCWTEGTLEEYREMVKVSVHELFYFMFFQNLPHSFWISFLKTSDCHTSKGSQNFCKNYALYPIETILAKTDLSDLQKERELRGEVEIIHHRYRKMYAEFRELTKFEVNDWRYMVKKWKWLLNRFPNLPEMIDYIFAWKQTCLSYAPEKYTNLEDLTLDEWKRSSRVFSVTPFALDVWKTTICFYIYRKRFRNVVFLHANSKSPYTMTGSGILYFSHEKSHFENGIFYLENKTPLLFYYETHDGHQMDATPSLWEWHKEAMRQADWKEAALHVHWNELCASNQEMVKSAFRSSMTQTDILDFYFNKVKTESLGAMLEKIHHVLGRIDPRYPLTEHHGLLKEILPLIDRRKLIFLEWNALFPEYETYDASVQKKLDSLWEESFSYWKVCFFRCLENDKCPRLFTKPVASCTSEPVALLPHLLKHPVLSQYIDEDAIFSSRAKKNCWKTQENLALAFLTTRDGDKNCSKK